MKIIVTALLLISTIAYADLGVVVSQSGIVISKDVYSGDTSGIADSLALRQKSDPTLSFVVFTLPDRTFDSTEVPLNQTKLRDEAIDLLNNDSSGNSKFTRAVLLVILDEINTIRSQLSLAPRTAAQIKTALQNKINSGVSD